MRATKQYPAPHPLRWIVYLILVSGPLLHGVSTYLAFLAVGVVLLWGGLGFSDPVEGKLPRVVSTAETRAKYWTAVVAWIAFAIFFLIATVRVESSWWPEGLARFVFLR